MRNHFLTLAASTLLAVGCTASGRMHTSASVSAPELVYIGPNVQVIADYDEPIFYTSSYYWRYNGGVWYRSSNHRSGWVRFTVVPDVITRIERPTAYIRYRGSARASMNNGQPQQPPQPQQSPQQRNEERREEKAEQKEERREDKAERKEDRKDAKEDRKDAKEDRKDAKDDHKHGKKGR